MSRYRQPHRGHMTPAERTLRSALNQLLSQRGLVHGSLVVRRRTCGKPNCRCAGGQLHEGLYLVVTEASKPRQMYVPRRLEVEVRQWIDNYGKARGLLDDLSRLHWDKVRQRQE